MDGWLCESCKLLRGLCLSLSLFLLSYLPSQLPPPTSYNMIQNQKKGRRRKEVNTTPSLPFLPRPASTSGLGTEHRFWVAC